jgi:hypothetical protein
MKNLNTGEEYVLYDNFDDMVAIVVDGVEEYYAGYLPASDAKTL